MAVAYDNAALTTGGGASPLTVGITVGSGADRGFVICVGNNQSGVTVTAASLGGVSATSAGARAINGNTSMHLWWGLAPASGAQTASITLDNTFAQISLHVITIDGVASFSDYASANAASGGTTDDITVTVPNIGANDMALCGVKGGGGGTLTAAGSTIRRTDSAAATRSASGTLLGSAGSAPAFDGQFSDAWVIGALRAVAASSGVVGPLMGGHLLGGGILAGRLVS